MTPLPEDDPRRALTVARPDDPDLQHLAAVSYTHLTLPTTERV